MQKMMKEYRYSFCDQPDKIHFHWQQVAWKHETDNELTSSGYTFHNGKSYKDGAYITVSEQHKNKYSNRKLYGCVRYSAMLLLQGQTPCIENV